MSIICGMEIKSAEIIVALVEVTHDAAKYVEASFNKIKLSTDNQDQYKSFSETFSEFVTQNNIGHIYSKKPMDKGQQLSGPNSFRIEAIISLLPIRVDFVHPLTLAAFVKKNTFDIQHAELSRKYQSIALWVAQWGIRNGA